MTPNILYSSDETEIRKALDRGKPMILARIEESSRKDRLRNMTSGLTPVMARLAAKQNSKLGIDIPYLKKAEKTQKARMLARLKQNIRLARKAILPLTHHGNALEAHYLVLSLGGSTKQAAEIRSQSF